VANKLTLIDATAKTRILPTYYSDNYVSLLPGESRTIEIEYPATAAHDPAAITPRAERHSSTHCPEIGAKSRHNLPQAGTINTCVFQQRQVSLAAE
jgi:Exo-beta-D-glucosaminidase Ig-fold domain